jgi:Beta-propeller repeat
MITGRRMVRWAVALLSVVCLNPMVAETPMAAGNDDSTGASSDPDRQHVLESLGRLPRTFELNRGQAHPAVQFVSRGPADTAFLTSSEMVFVLANRPSVNPASFFRPESQESDYSDPKVVRMKFVGANPQNLAGENEQRQRSNYLIGRDPRRWHTQVPHYARLSSDDLYPGIDIVYHGLQRQIEYDLIVAPDASPRSIRMAFAGVDAMTIDQNGDLILQTGGITLHQSKPVAYQVVNGDRRHIAASYVRTGSRTVGFRLGSYNHKIPLIIDPILPYYSTYLGGLRDDHAFGIAVDKEGSAYITGQTASIDFPTANPFQPSRDGAVPACFVCADAFISKLDPTGSALIYSTYLGGAEHDHGETVGVDGDGNAYVAGLTSSRDFPTRDAMQATHGGSTYDAFVTKLNSAGSALVYSTYLGGRQNDGAGSIAIDGSGNAFVTGTTFSPDFPTLNALQPALGGQFGADDVFVTALTGSGGLFYSSYLGGSKRDLGFSIAIDNQNNIYLTGITSSPDFPTANPLQVIYGGPADICVQELCGDVFIAKLDPTGVTLIYSTYVGGSGDEGGLGIAVSATGEAYLTGFTTSTNFPTHNALQAAHAGDSDQFILKMNATGSALVFSTYLGGSAYDQGSAIATDASGNVYVAGRTNSPDFPVANPFQPVFGGNLGFCYDASCGDATVAKISASGSALLYSSFLGGGYDDEANGIAVDRNENAYVTGFTFSCSAAARPFPVANPLQSVSGASCSWTDAFVTKVGVGASVMIDIKPRGLPNSIKLDTNGRVSVAILSSQDFDATYETNQASLTFGRTGDERSLVSCEPKPQDVNQDQHADLLCHFSVAATEFIVGDTLGVLRGFLVNGTPFQATDSVRIIP